MNGKFSVFYALLAKMPGATKEGIVYQYSGGTSLSELYDRSPTTYRKMIADMKKITAGGVDTGRLDKLRKMAIASVAGFFEKAGLYTDLTRRERLKKIIATVCRAGGADDLNAMTEAQLRRVYGEFVRRQKISEKAEQVHREAVSETGRVIRKGCLSLTLPG